MARLWSSGFELNTTTANVEITSSGGGGSIQNTTKRSGAYAARLTPSAGTAYVYYAFASSNQTAAFYFRGYLRVATFPGAGNYNYIIQVANVSPTVKIAVALGSDQKLRLVNYEDSADIDSASSALSVDTWYRLELKVDTTTISSTSVEAKIDGITFASGTVNLTTGIGILALGTHTGTSTYDAFFDDVAINNSDGSFQNSWPGEGEIIHLRPNATGDNSDWNNSNLSIDEVTPDDASTSIDSHTEGEIEDVNLDATPAAMDSDDVINCVQVGVRFVGTNGDSNGFVSRIKASSGGTLEESSEIIYSSTTWVTNKAASPRNYNLTLYDLPGASATGWTKADLDTTQIGVRLSTFDFGSFEVSTLWLLVDHKPAPPATTTSTSSTSSSSSTSTTSTSLSTSSTSSSTSTTSTSSSTSSTSSSTSSTSSSSSTSSTSSSSSTSSTSSSSSTSTTSSSTSTTSTSSSSSTSTTSSSSSTSTTSSSSSTSTTSTSSSSSTSSTSSSTSTTSSSSSTSTTSTSSSSSTSTTSSSSSTSTTSTSSSSSTSSTSSSSSTSTTSTSSSSSTSSTSSSSSTSTTSSSSSTSTSSTSSSTSTTSTSSSSSTSTTSTSSSSSTSTTSTSISTSTTSSSSSTSTTSTSTSSTSSSSSTSSTSSSSSTSTTSTSSSTSTSSTSSSSSTSSTSSSSSTSSTSTSTSTTTTLSFIGCLAFGEESPTEGETPISWTTWDGTGAITGDADWGKLQLNGGETQYSQVYDHGEAIERQYTIAENVYGTGQGDATLYYRGSVDSFDETDELPVWTEYTGVATETYRYFQIKEVK